jgi:hypothetical protein
MFTIEQKVVVRFRGGRLIKGYISHFDPDQDHFHVSDAEVQGKSVEVSTSQLKAIFFVKSFEGNPDHPGAHEIAEKYYDDQKGSKVKVTFTDGEVMFGTTSGFAAGLKGFFLMPADPEDNNEKIFVFARSTDKVEPWE